jgi:DCN1-like protein 1/2
MGEDSEKMDLTSTQQYFKDIGVNLEDVSCFLAFAIVNCMSIGEISKEGFVDGWSNQKYELCG